jgi:hypothetical protein
MKTKHSGEDVELDGMCWDCKYLPTPLHYKSSVIPLLGNTFTTYEGVQVNCLCSNTRNRDRGENFYAVTYNPGGRCCMAGMNKFMSSLCDVVCCPVNLGYWACAAPTVGPRRGCT